MLKKLESIHIFIIMIADFVNESCGSGNFLFKQKTISSNDIELGDQILTDSPWWFSEPGDKLQLCHYAKMEADLPYMDYNVIESWYKHKETGLTKIMRCPTLPTIFLVKRDWMDVVQITFLKSGIDDIVFNTEAIKEAQVVSLDENENKKQCIKPSRFTKLSAEDRKNLCAAAGKLVNVFFLHNQVPGAQLNKFRIEPNQEEIYLTIPCPTLPKLYLYSGTLENEVELLVVRNSVDFFEFEVDEAEPVLVYRCGFYNLFKHFHGNPLLGLGINDRVALCRMAREYASITGTDSDVLEAELYSFNYSGGKEIRGIALRCPKLPEVYLQLADPSNKKIKIIFVRNPYEHFNYAIEFFESIYRTENTEEIRERIKGHWFSTLHDEDRWKLCYAVQKRISHSLKLKTAPLRSIESPMVREFVCRYPIDGIRSAAEDVTIKCSGLPEVYVRIMQQSKDDDKKEVQIAVDVDYFDIPGLRTLSDEYHEEQDNYDG